LRSRHYPAWQPISIVLAVALTAFLTGALYRLHWNGAKPKRSLPPAGASTPAALPSSTIREVGPGNATKPPEMVPEPAPPVLLLSDVQYLPGPNSSTITVDVDDGVHYEINRLTNPDRIYLDLHGSKMDPALSRKKFQVADPVLQAIRVAEHKGNFTRVTLETKRFCDYLLTTVRKSHQLQIQITQSGWAELSSGNDDPSLSATAR